MIKQLVAPIPLSTPKGNALAHFLIDYGAENHLIWVCFQDETGECWAWPNPQIRAQKNISMGRALDGGKAPRPPGGKPKPLKSLKRRKKANTKILKNATARMA